MKGSRPDSASSPIAFGSAFAVGALVRAKSGTSRPVLEVRGGTIVEDPAVGRPRPAPLELRADDAGRIGLLAGREIAVLLGEHPAVDPGGAGGGAVVLEVAEAGDVQVRLAGVVPVDLPEDLVGVGLTALALARVVRVEVPGQAPDPPVTRLSGVRVQLLEPERELMGQPQIGPA